MFDDGIISLSSLEILIEACDKAAKEIRNKFIFWQYIENNLPSIVYLQKLNKGTWFFGFLGKNHLIGRLTQVFEVSSVY